MRVVPLSSAVQVLVPTLLVPTVSRGTRGVSFDAGRVGFILGSALLASSAVLGWLLWGVAGVWGALGAFWLLGTTGIVMMAGSLRPLAFVKPICVKCRLLPIIVEHEAIHLSGVAREEAVWVSMRLRHSAESLGLDGDPAICWFCPIPKRLKGH